MGDRRARAIRGATTVESDAPEQIRRATRELLETIVERNGITSADVISAIFTVTHDLTSEFPAHAARELGWLEVPAALHARDPRARLARRGASACSCTSNPTCRAPAIRHVYLHDARTLRPDLARER